MFDERAFIAKVESAGPEELANILVRPTLDEEKALRAHLGDGRYQRMHSMALKRKVGRGFRSQPKGNVVVIHGIMGGELSVSSGGSGDLTWVSAFRIMRGWLDRLRLSDDGRSEANQKFKVAATGIMKRYYGEMLLSLSENWNVKAFWFDWRKDLDLAADELNTQMGSWFANNAPVHIVAHSMGGLVARTFIQKYGNRWKTMWDNQGHGKAGGRLVMLGTPNHGSFAIPQVITGLEGLVRKVALIDLRHDVHDLLNTFNSFVGSYQMLPSPLVMPEIEALYNSGSYSAFNVTVSQPHLNNARAHHSLLSDAIDFGRMIYVAGFDQPTFSGVKDWKKLHKTEGYVITRDGDGRVPHALGLLWSANKKQKVKTYYIKEDHGNLSTNSKILAALDELLESGETDALLPELPAARAAAPSQEKLRKQYDASQQSDEDQLLLSLRRMGTRGVRSDSDVDPSSVDQIEMNSPRLVSPEERKVEETLTRGFLSQRGGDSDGDEDFEDDPGLGFAEIEIGLVHGDIDKIDYENTTSQKGHAIDVISVGHYIGVQPQAAELSLDYAISSALIGRGLSETLAEAKQDLILTQYTDRGIIQGKLGQPFILPDPRPPKGRKTGTTGRLIALAGMNEPGRFGVPELVVLSRELCWALGRLNRLHLATVVIGAGEGNLGMRDSVSGWLTGIRRAVSGSRFDEGRRLHRVTFVERDPRKVIRLDSLISRERDRHKKNKTGFEIRYDSFSKAKIEGLKQRGYEEARAELDRNLKRNADQEDDVQAVPARVTLSLDQDGKTYRFGAITDTASVPERDTVIDSKLVWQANDELAGEQKPSMQLERGRFLEGILMPPDLRKQLYSRAPLVMMLDSTTARIHWEMVAQPATGMSLAGRTGPTADGERFEYADDFLGTTRGLTRQLRTNFAPPPEPPPPPQHTLRVLVVADPAADAHLPGAQEEGAMVADLFERYNVVKRKDASATRVQVKRLFGPIEATRTNVLRELMIRPYDVLHFAGHCVYKWDGDPSLSGWIFNAANKELLTANELYRIDRIPKFVFSNACESGITPDRSQERNDKLAPSFAEAFFARGVANFVCTAWPVDDEAARTFALTLYGGLLGINPNTGLADCEPLPMHVAIKDARLAIAATSNGKTTWGAYQHYGNPYFQFLFPESNGKAQQTARGAARSASKKKKSEVRRKKATKKRGRL
jgi:pimeloyl-ACP methyl ester carboxylesterase